MAQPNVAREPSMEEILASIRRIIESNEPVADNALSPGMSEYGDEMDEAEDAGFTPGIVANDRGMPLRNEPLRDTIGFTSAPAAQPQQPEARTLSLADVAARVRAASSRQQETGTARPAMPSAPSLPPIPAQSTSAQSMSAPATPVAPAPVSSARQEDPVSLRPQMPRMPELREQQAAPARAPQPVSQPAAQPAAAQRINPPVFDPPQLAPVKAEAQVRPEVKAVSEAPAQTLPATIEETANLLSAAAGAQVAKSFSDLAAVFNGMERRSLEDMAGDMLRPMLQEWLDDNLPTLVERLVREEIERVSRGQRR